MKRRITLLGFALGLCLAAGGACTWNALQPRILHHATSPDQSWSVTITGKRIIPFGDIRVSMQLYDRQEGLVVDRRIESADYWSDIGDAVLECENDVIHVLGDTQDFRYERDIQGSIQRSPQ